MGLLVVSNRLPLVLSRTNGELHVEPSSGGLTTALAPVLRNRGGTWIGWSGAAVEDLPENADEVLRAAAAGVGYRLRSVPLTAEEKARFYHGFCNEVIWPLFHDLPSYCNFDPTYWPAYRAVNRKYAEAAAEEATAGAFIWVHDYQLLTVAQELREAGVQARLGFFLHIPFPPPDLFLELPWRFPILRALLEFDLVGFQTVRDRRNFVQCVQTLLPGFTPSGKGAVQTLTLARKSVRVGVFPIGIDFHEFADLARETAVFEEAKLLHEALPKRQLVLGVDRLDYTKGIPHKLRAFATALARHPEIRREVSLIQVVVPSREDIAKYADLKREIERLVGEINGRWSEQGWVPVHYFYRSLTRPELLAFYRAAEVALVTPLKDGMNLVAKEYCAASVDERRVLILSEFAGAAAELRSGALLVNPFDVDGVADTIHRALTLPGAERRARMRKLRRIVRTHDIYRWVDSFLRAVIARELEDFPVVEGGGAGV